VLKTGEFMATKTLWLDEIILQRLKIVSALKKMTMTAYASDVLDRAIKEDSKSLNYKELDLNR
jgi:hypothetical protein